MSLLTLRIWPRIPGRLIRVLSAFICEIAPRNTERSRLAGAQRYKICLLACFQKLLITCKQNGRIDSVFLQFYSRPPFITSQTRMFRHKTASTCASASSRGRRIILTISKSTKPCSLRKPHTAANSGASPFSVAIRLVSTMIISICGSISFTPPPPPFRAAHRVPRPEHQFLPARVFQKMRSTRRGGQCQFRSCPR